MNKWRPNKTSESGVTLIALLVMIIIIVILAAVVIRGLTGNEGLINLAETAAEDYKITAKKEMLDQVIRSEMIAGATLGKVTTLGEIAEVIRRQDGVKDVKIDGDKDATEGYIYVETTDRRPIRNLL